MTAGRLYIGTSGWVYGHWVGPFYPKEVKARDQLAGELKSFLLARSDEKLEDVLALT